MGIGAFCLAVWVCLAWCRLIRGSFFGLDRLSPRPPSCWLASVALSLVPGAWCCVEAVGSSPAEPEYVCDSSFCLWSVTNKFHRQTHRQTDKGYRFIDFFEYRKCYGKNL